MTNNSLNSLSKNSNARNGTIEMLANRCPQLKKHVDEAVHNLRERILNCDPLHLLQFAQSHMLFNEIGISSEFQQPSFDALAINRFTEYAQSIYVSGSLHITVQANSEENEFNSILQDFINLFHLLHEYYFSLSAKWTIENKYEKDLIDNVLESQLMYGVRGKRYQFVEKEYFTTLLSPHNEIFKQLFGLSADDIISGIIKLQYALSQGRFAALNKLAQMFTEFQSTGKEDLKSYLDNHFKSFWDRP